MHKCVCLYICFLDGRILPRNAQISISIHHEPPVLVNEFYVFHLSVKNDEVNKIDNVKLTVMLKEGQEQFIHDSSKLKFLFYFILFI